MTNLVILMVILNLFDAIVTVALVTSGLSRELNPLMNALINIHPMLFLGVKVFIVTALIILLDRLGSKRGLFLVSAIYSLLALHHLRSLYLVATGV